jgi:hypothetical protein
VGQLAADFIVYLLRITLLFIIRPMGFLLDLTIAQIDIMRLDTVERKQLEALTR